MKISHKDAAILLRQQLLIVMGQIDFTQNNCSMTQPVGSLIDASTLEKVNRVLVETRPKKLK